MAEEGQQGITASALVAKVDRIAQRARQRDVERAVRRGGAVQAMDFTQPRRDEPSRG